MAGPGCSGCSDPCEGCAGGCGSGCFDKPCETQSQANHGCICGTCTTGCGGRCGGCTGNCKNQDVGALPA